jgi:hypothetical protein
MGRLIFQFFYRIYCHLYGLLGLSRGQYRILVACPGEFQFFHLRPLILELASDRRFNIKIVEYETHKVKPIANTQIIHKRHLKRLMPHPIDMFLTTDFINPPGWFASTKTAFFLHGIGPKVSYFASPKLQDFDVVLAPSPFVEKKQRPFIKLGGQLVAAGLPALDEFFNAETSNDGGAAEQKDRPILLYAPSWSGDPAQITADRDIIEALVEQDVCDCIIRPHPLIMMVDTKENLELKAALLEAPQRNPAITLHAGTGTSIYDVLSQADLLMSDISSVLYEFLIFDRPILLYLKDTVAGFYEAEDIIEQTRKASFEVSGASSLRATLTEAIANKDIHASERRALLKTMLYNPGNATEVMGDFFKTCAEKK